MLLIFYWLITYHKLGINTYGKRKYSNPLQRVSKLYVGSKDIILTYMKSEDATHIFTLEQTFLYVMEVYALSLQP